MTLNVRLDHVDVEAVRRLVREYRWFPLLEGKEVAPERRPGVHLRLREI